MEIHGVIEKLRSPDWFERKKAIAFMVEHPEDEYIELIEGFLRDHSDANTRNGAMELLRALGTRAVPHLIRLLGDRDEDVRIFSANMLGDIKDLRAVLPLIHALKDNSPNVRAASAEALGKIKSPEALAHLEKCLSDDPWVGQAAIDAIGEIGGDGALRILYHAIENPHCRDMAIDAIGRAGDSNSIRVLTPLIESGRCSETALMAIVRIVERENSKPMPEYFVSLMPMLLSLKDSPRPELRTSAMKALCWSEQVSAIPCLVDAIGEEELQEYAIEGLLSIGKKAVPSIIDALKNPDKRGRPILAKILSMLGEHMALARFTDDIDPEVRVEAALALGKVPSERSVRLLSELLSDTEEEVRAAAARAIDSLNKLI